MKAVLQYRASDGFRRSVQAMVPEWLNVTIVDDQDQPGFAAAMMDAEVLLHVLEPVTTAVMAAAPKLKLIQKIGVGVNTIDLEAARKRGIVVANMPGTNTQAVAEHTLALMFAALRKVPMLDRATRAGRGWGLPVNTFDSLGEIGGRTVGLVGYGAVPQRLAPVLDALGAQVLYTARMPKTDARGSWRALDALLAESDLVSLHVPLTGETRKLINEATLARMKPGAVLINTGRGGLVDELALADALRRGHIASAGLDVLDVEPAVENPLFGFDNVVVTPHIAWLTPETIERSLAVAFDNCQRLRRCELVLNQV
jgi:phosphoglycerate dehydrogenase-like enzyme